MWNLSQIPQILKNLWEFGSNSTDFEWWFRVESGVIDIICLLQTKSKFWTTFQTEVEEEAAYVYFANVYLFDYMIIE